MPRILCIISLVVACLFGVDINRAEAQSRNGFMNRMRSAFTWRNPFSKKKPTSKSSDEMMRNRANDDSNRRSNQMSPHARQGTLPFSDNSERSGRYQSDRMGRAATGRSSFHSAEKPSVDQNQSYSSARYERSRNRFLREREEVHQSNTEYKKFELEVPENPTASRSRERFDDSSMEDSGLDDSSLEDSRLSDRLQRPWPTRSKIASASERSTSTSHEENPFLRNQPAAENRWGNVKQAGYTEDEDGYAVDESEFEAGRAKYETDEADSFQSGSQIINTAGHRLSQDDSPSLDEKAFDREPSFDRRPSYDRTPSFDALDGGTNDGRVNNGPRDTAPDVSTHEQSEQSNVMLPPESDMFHQPNRETFNRTNTPEGRDDSIDHHSIDRQPYIPTNDGRRDSQSRSLTRDVNPVHPLRRPADRESRSSVGERTFDYDYNSSDRPSTFDQGKGVDARKAGGFDNFDKIDERNRTSRDVELDSWRSRYRNRRSSGKTGSAGNENVYNFKPSQWKQPTNYSRDDRDDDERSTLQYRETDRKELGRGVPGRRDFERRETSRSEPERNEPGRGEPGRGEPGRGEPGRGRLERGEFGRRENTRSGVGRDEYGSSLQSRSADEHRRQLPKINPRRYIRSSRSSAARRAADHSRTHVGSGSRH